MRFTKLGAPQSSVLPHVPSRPCRAVAARAEKDSGNKGGGGIPLDPVEVIKYGGRIQLKRRLVSSIFFSTAVAIGGNFLGVTSFLLSLDGGKAADTSNLSVLVPVNGRKKALDTDNGYSFYYPAEWLADQRLYQQYAAEVERRSGLDPPSLRDGSGNRRRRPLQPTAAFGPAGSTGETNVSVIVAPIQPMFRLKQLGGPERSARSLLENTIAPEGSNKVADLIAWGERTDASGVLYYTMEYTVRGPTFYRHNLSVYAARNGLLYTLNAQCPGDKFDAAARDKLSIAVETFQLLPGSAGAEFPSGL